MYKNKKITLFSHLLTWVVLFSMPYILSYEKQDINRVIAHFWIPIFFYAVLFYSNFFLWIDKFLFAKKTVQFIVINIGLIALFMTLKEQIESVYFEEFLRKKADKNEGGGPPFSLFIYVQTLSYIAPLLFSIAIKATKRWAKTEAERKEATTIKLQSELQHLRYQIQPHFFFNSLNNIYSLVDISPEQAKTTIHSLSKLMRYLLYDTNTEMISLSKEIEFIKKYISLMELRLTDNTVIHTRFPAKNTEVKIVPLLFISLIENAFKHGVSSQHKSDIEFEMYIDNDILYFTSKNDNYPKEQSDKSGSGIGLQNLEKRLQLLYPNKHQFTTNVVNNQFVARLEIHL
ncbi:two-component sensor histidine kinase [Wenyingzhuangia heitensis]|uniref:Two-component sensor histidine kinase n=1 Tax=Wenyingzhuangia heitensis TaxID=1487859 RepID=A0ABX0UGV9_9FLAO|nr:histidine kinase [Wenyingzhuangia heitensis]NIJ46426.1 two-component sensor histidine kinase [Wenyingzhuangia heitensis]